MAALRITYARLPESILEGFVVFIKSKNMVFCCYNYLDWQWEKKFQTGSGNFSKVEDVDKLENLGVKARF